MGTGMVVIGVLFVGLGIGSAFDAVFRKLKSIEAKQDDLGILLLQVVQEREQQKEQGR